MPNDVTVDLGNEYIGSAYSPQVEITETPTGHEIAITHASPDAAGQLVTDEFFVPNYSGEEADREAAEAARAAAEAERAAAESEREAYEAARQSAESERASAESARDATETQRASAESARAAAESTRATAEQGRASAESARVAAEQARAEAETARESASATAVHNAEVATSAAQSATTAAQSATSAATTATTNANSATAAANTAAANANAATIAAQTATTDAQAATTAAQDAADLATTAAETVTDAYFPMLTAGVADGIKGGGPTVDAAFLHRVTGGGQASDGPATIEVVRGNTIRWNQLCTGVNDRQTIDGLTFSQSETGGLNVSGTVTTAPSSNRMYISNTVTIKRDGRKYLCMLSKDIGIDIFLAGFTASYQRRAFIFSNNYNGETIQTAIAIVVHDGDAFDLSDVHASVFDLTTMFGAGSEPSTVAEFETLYGNPYYPYDAGSLLPVQMEGIETVGFNQWDEEWESGQFNTTTGAKVSASDRIRSKNYIPVFPNTEYYFECSTTSNAFTVCYYDAAKRFIGAAYPTMNSVVTTPTNARYLMFTPPAAYGITYNNDICFNLSWSGRRNGEYEPFWSSERAIAAETYFPDGMRSAGSVRDELTGTEAIHRVGEVTLTAPQTAITDANGKTVWTFNTTDAIQGINSNVTPSITCDRYIPEKRDYVIGVGKTDNSICIVATAETTTTLRVLGVYDPNVATATLAEAQTYFAAHPFTVYYALATPTVTPIDPPLNLSYRAEQGGTETVLVPTGEMSAPVPMVIVYGSTPDGILDRSASLLAAQDGPTATANHAIGSYLTMGGTLYRVTTAIASGEAIVPGTNVTATTVMAEVLTLIQ